MNSVCKSVFLKGYMEYFFFTYIFSLNPFSSILNPAFPKVNCFYNFYQLFLHVYSDIHTLGCRLCCHIIISHRVLVVEDILLDQKVAGCNMHTVLNTFCGLKNNSLLHSYMSNYYVAKMLNHELTLLS